MDPEDGHEIELERDSIDWRLAHQSSVRSIGEKWQHCTGFEKHVFFSLLAAGKKSYLAHISSLCCLLIANEKVFHSGLYAFTA